MPVDELRSLAAAALRLSQEEKAWHNQIQTSKRVISNVWQAFGGGWRDHQICFGGGGGVGARGDADPY